MHEISATRYLATRFLECIERNPNNPLVGEMWNQFDVLNERLQTEPEGMIDCSRFGR